MNYLITPTLLNSFDYFLSMDKPEWKEKAKNDFSNILYRRFPSPTPKPIELGNRFEDAVYRVAAKDKIPGVGSEAFRAICKELQGGRFQQNTKKYIEVDGEKYCLWGRMDVTFPSKIIDIKTTQNYRGRDKYLSGWQHHIYTLCTKIKDFVYLVVVLDEEERIDEVHHINYTAHDLAFTQLQIEEQIRTIRNYLQDKPDLDEAYRKIFSRNG